MFLIFPFPSQPLPPNPFPNPRKEGEGGMIKSLSEKSIIACVKVTVRQEVASQIAEMPLPPFGVTLLWHAFSVMKRCEAHKTM